MKKMICLLLLGCGGGGGGGDEGDDGGPEPVDPADVAVTNPASGPSLPLGQVKYWAYQIQNHYANPQALADSHYDLLVVDQARSISDLQDYDDAALVAKLQSSSNHLGGKKLVICYIDIGEAEDYRWYWQSGWGVGNPAWITGADPDGWTGNYPVKFWDPQWKAIVLSYVDRILADGYDGIYMDWLEAYDFEPVIAAGQAEGKDPATEMAKFVREISEYAKAKKPGFLVIGQNGTPLGAHADYLNAIDAQAQEHVWFYGETGGAPGDLATPATGDWSTAGYLDRLAVFQNAGKPIFTCDYATQGANVQTCYSEAAQRGFVEYVTTVELDVLTTTPPPGY